MHTMKRRHRWLLLGSLVALPVAISLAHGCCAFKTHHHRRLSPEVSVRPDEERELAAQAGLSHVLRFGPVEKTRPAVVLLHEIGGATPESQELALRLSQEGYTVYLPVLFGTVGQRSEGIGAIFSRCTGGDFHCFRSRAGELAERLRTKLVEAVALRHQGVGAIGMCLTGSFPLILAESSDVKAVVVSQPALPTFQGGALGISGSELDAVKRSFGGEILYFRFSDDCLSPPQRLDSFDREFPGQVRSRVFPSCDAEHHAVLTDSLTETPEAWSCLTEYLAEKLKGEIPSPSSCPSQAELDLHRHLVP